jgi:uncharacterized protein (TIGR02147 family)
MARRTLKDTDVFRHDDYRAFLRAAYDELKASNPAFSYRFFARKAGMSSPNFLKLVIDGHRNLSAEGALAFAGALSLNQEETEFFTTLVAFNQSRDEEDKNGLYRRLLAFRNYRQHRVLEKDHFEYLSHWYFVAIRELVSLPHFAEDPAWISEQLKFSMTPAEAADALKTMERLGILVRDGDGLLRQAAPHLTTGAEVVSLGVRNFHREMMRLAAESMTTQPREVRDISGLTVAISNRQATAIKERLKAFRKELLEIVAEDDAPEGVYQLNLQWFALAMAETPGPDVPSEAGRKPGKP